MTISKKYVVDVIAALFCLLFIVAGCLVSLNRYWQYEESYIDFGQYDQSIWKVAHFQAPIVHHFIHGTINVLGDHVTPSVFLISPLYWFTSRSEMILIVQAIAVGLSGFVLYDLAKHVLKNKLLSLSVVVSYLLFVGLQNAVITEFHELTVMTLPLMLSLWAIVKNKIGWYFFFLIITLGFKEITFALGLGIGLALILLKKEWRIPGIITMGISLLWALIAFKIIIPYFSHGQYLYASSLPTNVVSMVTGFFDSPIKRHTLTFSFLSFSFMPFLAPQFWVAIVQDYASRFLPQNFVTRWDLGMHYNAQSAVLLALSSVFGLQYLFRFSFIKKYATVLAVLLMLNALVLFRVVLHGPFLLALNPVFYRHTNEMKFLDTAVSKVPPHASVMTQNNLGARFTHQDVQLITTAYTTVKPDYILLDVRDGQSPNNYFGSDDFMGIYHSLLHDNNYTIYYHSGDQYVFKRK